MLLVMGCPWLSVDPGHRLPLVQRSVAAVAGLGWGRKWNENLAVEDDDLGLKD